MILVDTNVLVYAVNGDAPQHEACRALIEAVRAEALQCALVPQVLLEFQAIVTDRRRVASPLAAAQAWEACVIWQGIFRMLEAGRAALARMSEVIVEKGATGGGVFDAWLVAQMRALGVDRICTYNERDFASYKGISTVRPEELV